MATTMTRPVRLFCAGTQKPSRRARPTSGPPDSIRLVVRKSNGVNSQRGVTLIEILVASLIGALLAGGTMMAFVMARKLGQGSARTAEATPFAQQTIERFRNMIACDGAWFNSSNCSSGPSLPTNWTSDPLPTGSPLLALGGTRQYKVTPKDCDGDGTSGDCFEVQTQLQWTPPQ